MLRHKRLKCNLENGLKYTACVWHTCPKQEKPPAKRPGASYSALFFTVPPITAPHNILVMRRTAKGGNQNAGCTSRRPFCAVDFPSVTIFVTPDQGVGVHHREALKAVSNPQLPAVVRLPFGHHAALNFLHGNRLQQASRQGPFPRLVLGEALARFFIASPSLWVYAVDLVKPQISPAPQRVDHLWNAATSAPGWSAFSFASE